jgi:hypothetical protein
MKQLERILFAQGGECFFCKQPLPKEKASVEHLVALANGGRNEEDNCVVCCKQLNSLLGSKSIKAKILVVLNQRGAFICPTDSEPLPDAQPALVQVRANDPAASTPRPKAKKAPRYVFTLAGAEPSSKSSARKADPVASSAASKPATKQPPRKLKDDNFSLVVANLKQRGTSKPRTLKTLSSTVSALLPKGHAKSELTSLLQQLQSNGKVLVSEGKVSYAL